MTNDGFVNIVVAINAFSEAASAAVYQIAAAVAKDEFMPKIVTKTVMKEIPAKGEKSFKKFKRQHMVDPSFKNKFGVEPVFSANIAEDSEGTVDMRFFAKRMLNKNVEHSAFLSIVKGEDSALVAQKFTEWLDRIFDIADDGKIRIWCENATVTMPIVRTFLTRNGYAPFWSSSIEWDIGHLCEVCDEAMPQFTLNTSLQLVAATLVEKVQGMFYTTETEETMEEENNAAEDNSETESEASGTEEAAATEEATAEDAL